MKLLDQFVEGRVHLPTYHLRSGGVIHVQNRWDQRPLFRSHCDGKRHVWAEHVGREELIEVLLEDARRERAEPLPMFDHLIELVLDLQAPRICQNAAVPQCPLAGLTTALEESEHDALVEQVGHLVQPDRPPPQLTVHRSQAPLDILV